MTFLNMGFHNIHCPECSESQQITLPKRKEPVEIETTGFGGSLMKNIKNDFGMENEKKSYHCNNCNAEIHIYYE